MSWLFCSFFIVHTSIHAKLYPRSQTAKDFFLEKNTPKWKEKKKNFLLEGKEKIGRDRWSINSLLIAYCKIIRPKIIFQKQSSPWMTGRISSANWRETPHSYQTRYLADLPKPNLLKSKLLRCMFAVLFSEWFNPVTNQDRKRSNVWEKLDKFQLKNKSQRTYCVIHTALTLRWATKQCCNSAGH